MHEIETKVLEVDVEAIKKKLKFLGAKEIQNTRLIVDWYGPVGTKKDKQPWYLRDRISFVLKDWNFDLDKYPNMPAYLEIEGKNHEYVQEAIKLLDLEGHRSIGEGERILIEKEYGLNWSDMRF